jgi:hypothetical protein
MDEWPEWKAAMESQYQQIISNKTYELVPRKEANGAVIPLKWVYDQKLDSHGNVVSLKARIVARGDKQQYSINYEETTSPVMRPTTKNILLALAARNGWHVRQGDFSSAYLNGILRPREGECVSEEQAKMPPIYVEQPPGFEVPGFEDFICLLFKAIYGLKQSGRIWYQTVHLFLVKDVGFICSKFDPAVFYCHVKQRFLVLGIHVDDPMTLGSSLKEIEDLEWTISSRFNYRIQGEITHFLGCSYERDWEKGTISAHQGKYIDAAISFVNLEDAAPSPTPLLPREQLGKDLCPTDPEEIAYMRSVPYRQLLGLLMYVANGTRPDICYAVNMLAQVSNNPGRAHWLAAKRIVRYLKGTRELRLVWGSSSQGLVGYSDASHGAQDLKLRSMSGYVFLITGGAISWSAKKQTLTSQSSAESEYIALAHAGKELLWIRHFIAEVFRPLTIPTTLFCDNQSAIALAKNFMFSPQNKHIGLRFHFIREVVANSQANLQWIGTHFNIADLFTKSLDSSKVSTFVFGLGLTCLRGSVGLSSM